MPRLPLCCCVSSSPHWRPAPPEHALDSYTPLITRVARAVMHRIKKEEEHGEGERKERQQLHGDTSVSGDSGVSSSVSVSPTRRTERIVESNPTPHTHTHQRESWMTRQAHLLQSHWKSDILPFIACMSFFLLTYWFNCLMQVMTQRREDIQAAALEHPFDYYRKHTHKHVRKKMEDVMQPQPQPDLLYHILPYFTFWWLNDLLAVSLMIVLLIKFTFLSRCRLSMIFKRFFMIQGLLFALRGLSIYLTGMSVPLTACESEITEERSDSNSAAVEAFYVMVGIHRTCADLLFSGHAAFYTQSFLLVWTYSLGEEWLTLFGWRQRIRQKREEIKRKREQSTINQLKAQQHATLAVSSVESIQSVDSQIASPQGVVTPAPSTAAATGSVTHTIPSESTALLTNEQVNQEAHDTVAQDHPWLIPELNAAGDPSQGHTAPHHTNRRHGQMK